MKKSELKQLIREEVRDLLKEATNTFNHIATIKKPDNVSYDNLKELARYVQSSSFIKDTKSNIDWHSSFVKQGIEEVYDVRMHRTYDFVSFTAQDKRGSTNVFVINFTENKKDLNIGYIASIANKYLKK